MTQAHGHTDVGFTVEEVELGAQEAAVVRGQVRTEDIAPFLGTAFSSVGEVVGRSGRAIVGPPFARYTLSEGSFDVEAGFPVDREVPPSGAVVPSQLPGGWAARLLHVGPYDTLGDSYDTLTEWLTARRHQPAGDPWECYLDGPEVESPRTIVYAPFVRSGDGA